MESVALNAAGHRRSPATAGAVLPTLANLEAPKFAASVAAMVSPMTRTRSQSQTTQ